MSATYQCRSILRNRLARSLWMVRQAVRMSQRELAVKVKTSRTSISHLERGDQLPNLETLTRLAESLGVPVGVIVRLAELE